MKKIYIYFTAAILFGITLFFTAVFIDKMWLGVTGFIITVAGLLCLMFTTKTGFFIFISSGILVIFGLLIFFGPIQLISGIQDLTQYYNNKGSVTEVDAVVTEIVESTDGEGGTDYRAYISYNYNEKAYNGVYWKMVSHDFPINSEVKVKISARQPDEVFRNGIYHYTNLVFPVFITVFLIIALISLPNALMQEYRIRKKNK